MIKDIINIIKDNINNKKNIDNTYVTQNVAIDDFKNNKHDSQINLENDFKWLDKILYCSLEQEINLAINKDMIGTMEYSYILKSYKITGVSNSITLELERKGDAYRISFNDIYDIKSAGPKIWIYQKDLIWRIYHYVDEIKFSSLEENFISKNLELQEDIQIYMKYKDIDNLLYNVEYFKYSYRLSNVDISQEEMIDKLGNEIILVNILDSKNSFDKHGTITAFSKYGKEGIFDYKLNSDYIYIIDMQPNNHSQGLGSKALELMENTARKHGITKLKGRLSPVDLEHKDRLIYFYEKNGFTIEGYKLIKNL